MLSINRCCFSVRHNIISQLGCLRYLIIILYPFVVYLLLYTIIVHNETGI